MPPKCVELCKKTRGGHCFCQRRRTLSHGAVDVLLENNIKAVGATRDAARIEWDKIYSMEMMQEICPQFTPFYRGRFPTRRVARSRSNIYK